MGKITLVGWNKEFNEIEYWIKLKLLTLIKNCDNWEFQNHIQKNIWYVILDSSVVSWGDVSYTLY